MPGIPEPVESAGASLVPYDALASLPSTEVMSTEDPIDTADFSEPESESKISCSSSETCLSPALSALEPVLPEETTLIVDESPDSSPASSELVQEPRDVVDLTISDDDEESSDFASVPKLFDYAAGKIKKEDTPTAELSKLQQLQETIEDVSMTDFDLPAVGETAIPDLEEPLHIGHETPMEIEYALFQANAQALRANRASLTSQQVPEPELQDGDEEDKNASKHFKAHKARYERRQVNGDTSVEEDIAFQKAKAAEQARQKFRRSRKEYNRQQADEESYLFIPEEDISHSESEDEPTLAELEIVKESPIVHEAEKKEKSKIVKRKPQAKKLSNGVAKPLAKSGSGGRRGRPKKTTNVDQINLSDLTNNNPIEEGRANEGLAAQPKLGGGRNKQNALVALIASLPESERDLHIGDKKKLEKASQKFTGYGAMKTAGEAGWLLRGMKSHLHHYQMLGASWMRDRENAGHPRGGILGDTMGFGKTVMCLANMVDGKPPKDMRRPRATLIVAPSNLISQWSNEIEKHVNRDVFKDRIIYRAGSRVICTDPSRTLGGQDVVITSYNEVMKSYPRNEPPSHLHTAEAKAEWWKTYFDETRGPLHLVKWHRIILDEAQMIKNHNSLTSQAVRCLQGKFRWCLTATPIQNSLDEFWAIMHFLREPSAGRTSFELFKQNFTRKGSQKSLERLQVILGKVMLRRTHANKMFDRPVLQLPPIAPVKTIEVKFNNVERQIYKIVRSRFVQKMKLIGLGGGQTQHYQQMLVLLLRLRQLVGHPLLIQKTLRDLMEQEDLERLWTLTQNYDHLASGSDPEFDVDADGDLATVKVLEVALTHAQNSESSTGSKAQPQDNNFSLHFRKYLQNLHDTGQWAIANARSLCQACGNPPEDPHITSCHHLYCFQCLNDLWYSEMIQHGPETNRKGTCLECGTCFDKCDAYQPKGLSEASSRRSTPSQRRTSDIAEEDIDWFNTSDPILRSAKIKGAVEQISTWLEQDKTNKIIVFVQFRGLIKILSRVLQEEGVGTVQFDGSMTFDARDEAIKRFSENPETPVLLAALKAGGIGLNLTAANRVIILDLWWNCLTENQAFCRAYRIGQKRAVEVVRFVVKDSIDTDMQAMQERKTKEIDSAMEKKNHRALSVAELMELFGGLETSKASQRNGEGYGQGADQPFVFPDDPYDKSDAESDTVMTE